MQDKPGENRNAVGQKEQKTGLQQGVFNPLTICPAFYTAVSHIDVSEVTE